MLLEVQRFLRNGGTLQDLVDERAIVVKRHDREPLVILNYDQIESRRLDSLCRECRGLCLEVGTWNVVARAFPRFFNLGEFPQEDATFDWSNVQCQTKEDGSLTLLSRYRGQLRVQTRGSFADGEVGFGYARTWEDLFWSTGVDEIAADDLVQEGQTLVFELCSPFNKVVRRYQQPTLFLLTGYDNVTGRELDAAWCDMAAELLRVGRPKVYQVSSPADIASLLDAEQDPTFEGFVVRDQTGRRLKVKSARYVALHHLRGNGDNLFAPKHLLPFILGNPGEEDELLTYFSEATETYYGLKKEVEDLRQEMRLLWDAYRSEPSQKEFALSILTRGVDGLVAKPLIAGFLFEARKRGVHPDVIWAEKALGGLPDYFKKARVVA